MAVFTSVSEEQLKAHLAQYDIGALVGFTGIEEGVSNTNYKIVTTGDSQGDIDFILTLFEERTPPESLPFFIAFMQHLYAKGIPCPDVIAAKNGDAIISLGKRPAVITSFLQGRGPKQIEPFHAAAMGQTLGQLHLAGMDFSLQRKSTMALPTWRSLIKQCEGKSDLVPFLQAELEYLERNWPQGLPGGAIHADLFPDNIFFMGRELTGVIDFYFSCTDVFVYDLMLTLNAWCFEDGAFNREKTSLFLKSYQQERALTEKEKAALTFFGRAAAVRIIATRLYDGLHVPFGALVTPKDPHEHVKILEYHQHETISL
jgi:homoserine kinase type II